MEGTGKQEMDALVDEILKSYEAHPETCSINTRNRISKDIIIDILEEIRSVVFPGYFEVKNLNAQSIEYHIGELLEDIHYRLRKQVAKALYHTNEKSIREEDAQLRAGGDREGISETNSGIARSIGDRCAGSLRR